MVGPKGTAILALTPPFEIFFLFKTYKGHPNGSDVFGFGNTGTEEKKYIGDLSYGLMTVLCISPANFCTVNSYGRASDHLTHNKTFLPLS
jgi:hypothetical protein